jgi:P27 family predicted phage terminase small subunit
LENTKPAWTKGEGESNVPSTSLPRPAKFLSKEAKKKFRALVRQLATRKTVTEGDADLISIECSLWEQWQQSLLKIREEGSIRIYTRLGPAGPIEVERENLHVKIAQNCQRQMITILRQLGLTPSARDTVRPVAEPKKKEEEEYVLPEKDDVILPVEEIDLASIDETVIGNEAATTESEDAQLLRANAEIEKIMAEDDTCAEKKE